MSVPKKAFDEEREFGLASWTGQSLGMREAHRHLDLEINYVLSGAMVYLVGGRIVELPPRRICLLWGGVPHQMIRKGAPVEAIWVTIPLNTVLCWGLPEALVRPLLATGFLADPAPRIGDLDLLQQWMLDIPVPRWKSTAMSPTVRPPTDAVRRIVHLEIEARLRRFALAFTISSPSDPLPSGPSVNSGGREEGTMAVTRQDGGLVAVEAMAEYICGNYQKSINVVEVAKAAHLHPNYAMTLFRRSTGITISQYLTLQRIAHAQRLLVTTDDSVQTIALDSGFGSISRFYTAFQQQTGNSPRRFRLRMEPISSERLGHT